ncbi:MAG: sialate O-acetylesterase [Alistipes sp.]|nr:sialate O-acetylesterase [Alistipes sp.]
MKLKQLLLVAVCTLVSLTVFAARPLQTAKIFTDHMVLQQQCDAPVWGWAEPNAKVTVKPSWGGSYSTKVADDGSWRVAVATPEYGGPHTLKIACGKEKIELKDVYIGEVWVCSGQSNMEMPIKGFIGSNQPVNGSVEACMEAINYGNRIRIFTVPRNSQEEAPAADLPSGEWKRASYSSCADCSAIAYFFAQYVNDAMSVPVGVIVSAWGGTEIAPWMPRDCHAEALKGLVSDEEYSVRTGHIKPYKGRPRTAGALFNGMINPFKGYAARGFLWYQGCSNKRDNTFYDKLQAAMVERWRKEWGDTESTMPFYYVLIAPYQRAGSANGFSRGYFVENQAKTPKLISNCAYVSTEGMGGGPCIHPAEKRLVSRQLAMLALDRTYGVEGVASGAPEVKKISLKEGKYTIELTPGMFLFTPSNEPVQGFEVAGADRVFHPAKARAHVNKITVYVPEEVSTPQSVRFAFRDNPVSNVQNQYGFPLAPFRSDDWPLK